MDRMQIRYGILKSHQVSRGESATNVHIPSQQTDPMGYGGKTTDDHKVHMVSNQTRQQAFKIFHGVFSPAPFQAPAPHSKRGNAREFVPAAFCAGWLRATTYPPHKPAPFPTPSFSHTPAFSLSAYAQTIKKPPSHFKRGSFGNVLLQIGRPFLADLSSSGRAGMGCCPNPPRPSATPPVEGIEERKSCFCLNSPPLEGSAKRGVGSERTDVI